jgi:predicted N-formylglutamate amidohydrolase
LARRRRSLQQGKGSPELNTGVETIPGALDAGVLFLCDHASNVIPEEFGSLGLTEADLGRHIAYDIGAADLTRRLAALFGAPALLTRYSRLVIDVNRGADDPTLVMRLSDGAVVPGNAQAGPDEIARRLRHYWAPYREAISRRLDRMIETGRIPAVISLHSFTRTWKGRPRPWEVAALWDSDPRLPVPFMDSLRASGLAVGDNEPYDGALKGDTMDAEVSARGLANLLIEIRQDLIATREAAEAWADRLAPHLRPVLDRPDAHMIRRYASRLGARRPAEGRMAK